MNRKTGYSGRVGVLLVNVGTPDGTDRRSMRRYLSEFLSDRRIIERSRLIWYPILHGIILRIRPARSGKAYARIWNQEKNESPLRTYTRRQAEKLYAAFASENTDVDWAMRYGQPSVKDVAQSMIARGCKRLLLFPLYPQYSASTTASVNDVFFDTMKQQRFIPAIRTVPSYAGNPVYIDALAFSVRKHLEALDFSPGVILASYHGLPQSYVARGDPYFMECQQTTEALRHKLGMDEKSLIMTFQSRFGLEEWLQPYTDKTIKQLARNGIQSIAVIHPGFVSDCLETMDEIGNEAAKIFYQNGGKNFTHIPCLNDSKEGVHVMEYLVRRELFGWI